MTSGQRAWGRLQDYARVAAGQAGLAYIALWTIAYLALSHGSALFGGSGQCQMHIAVVLFYWTCTPGTLLAFLADFVNGALTCTYWALAFVAAAMVEPDARLPAAFIVGLHLIGFPAALLVIIRILERLCDRIAGREQPGARTSEITAATEQVLAVSAPQPKPRSPRKRPVTPRHTFGLRRPGEV